MNIFQYLTCALVLMSVPAVPKQGLTQDVVETLRREGLEAQSEVKLLFY